MKIIHTADIHLGSKMDTKFPREISDKRKVELRNTFLRLINYAKDNDIHIIMLAGDIFDSNLPFKKDKAFFYGIIKNNPQIDFLYLRGNHDKVGDFIYEGDNLKVFDYKWTKYEYGDVVISGIEITNENSNSMYSTLSLNKDSINLVMLHGQVGDVSGKDKVNIKKLRDKNIDYLALGHIHKYNCAKLDERGIYAYSGCIEGRGFDEAGERGFVVYDTDEMSATFVPFSERRINEFDVDITGIDDAYKAYLKVKECVNFIKRDIYRINLCGAVNFDIDGLQGDVEKYLANECFFVNVKNRTERKLDIGQFANDVSLRGEFVRAVYENSEYSDEEKMQIISCGLKALKGGVIE